MKKHCKIPKRETRDRTRERDGWKEQRAQERKNKRARRNFEFNGK